MSLFSPIGTYYCNLQILAVALVSVCAKPQYAGHVNLAQRLGVGSLTETIVKPPLIRSDPVDIGPLGIDVLGIVPGSGAPYDRPLVQHKFGALVPLEDPVVIANRIRFLRAKALAVAQHGDGHYANRIRQQSLEG